MSKIAVIQGHPDGSVNHLCHALAQAYIEGAESADHQVELVDLGQLDFPLLRDQKDWEKGISNTPEVLKTAQAAFVDADHITFIYPLWLGTMPAVLKGFLEQIFRPGMALSYDEGFPKPLLKGKSARVVITMGMPALVYRWYFLAHGLKNLERSILGIAGIRPIRSTLYGSVESVSDEKRAGWIEKMKTLGKAAR
ncbi:MAG: NAD(P)H-dependent oxidoreductase [Rhizobiaceae bacterium]